MCGICGLITYRDICVEETLMKGQEAQIHRGPNSQGTLVTNIYKWKIGLGHQRLSIIDLSNAGNQPMMSFDGSSYIAYNGEVYNYKEIRTELEQLGFRFKSNSDTEIVLTALHQFGLDKALNLFNGMWSFAWLNNAKKKMILARDRFGIKPLYYFFSGEVIIFASEIKAILAMASQKFTLNYRVIGEYLGQSLLNSSIDTFFKEIKKVPAGHYCEIDLNETNLKLKVKSYYQSIIGNTEVLSDEQLIKKTRELFFSSVELQLRSDVPVGVLLSGGLDSSSIASVAQKIMGKEDNIHLLSAVSNDKRFDESPYIDHMSRYLDKQASKVTLDLRAENALDYLQEVCWFNDEPVGSFSNVAHYLLMKEANKLGVTVILSGQGADELLCGYRKYLGLYLQFLVRKGKFIKAAGVLSGFLRNRTITNQFTFGEAKRYLPAYLRSLEKDIRGDSLKEYSPLNMGLGAGMNVEERQLLDIKKFSVPSLLHFEDRMSMAWSREIRVPFLDHRIVEFFLNLPVETKLYKGWTKYIFRKAMAPFLPKEITWRKDKQGFINPQSEWLKDRLRNEVLRVFASDSLIYSYKLINREKLLKKYEAFCRQPSNKGIVWFREVFNPLALEIWLRIYSKYIS